MWEVPEVRALVERAMAEPVRAAWTLVERVHPRLEAQAAAERTTVEALAIAERVAAAEATAARDRAEAAAGPAEPSIREEPGRVVTTAERRKLAPTARDRRMHRYSMQRTEPS